MTPSSLPLPASDNLTPSLCPPSILSSLAHLAGVPDATYLATTVVSDKTPEPYRAVLDYLSHSSTTTIPYARISQTGGTTADGTLLSAQGRNTLYVSSLDPKEPSHSLSDDEGESNDSEPRHRHDEKSALQKYKEAGTVDVPKHTFGFGCAAITWPPPKNLEAEYLFNQRVSNSSSRTGDSQSPPGDVQKKCITAVTSIEADVTPPVSTTTDCDETGTILYVAHYPVGPPVKSCCGPEILHAVTIASTEPSPVTLRPFLKDVCVWKKTKDRHPDRGDGYALFRVKRNYGNVWWEFEGIRRSRPTGSVILSPGILDKISNDVERFLSPTAVRWYVEHGLPHRRAFLFEGPPGTGKTSTVRAIASKFHLSCCFLTLTDKKFSNQALADALSEMPRKALLILEDIDALFDRKRRQKGGSSSSLTFSGLLNALDGVASIDHLITVMTTNHPERLDAALMRGGRVDRRFYFGYTGRSEIISVFTRFFPNGKDELKQQFADTVMDRPEKQARSIATLQQLFILYRDADAETCVKGAHDFFNSFFAKGDKESKVKRNKKEENGGKVAKKRVVADSDGTDSNGSESSVDSDDSSRSDSDTESSSNKESSKADAKTHSSLEIKFNIEGSKADVVLSKLVQVSKLS